MAMRYWVVTADTDYNSLTCWSTEKVGCTTDFHSLLKMGEPVFLEVNKDKFADQLVKVCVTKSDVAEGLAAGVIAEVLAGVDRVLADQDHAGISDAEAGEYDA